MKKQYVISVTAETWFCLLFFINCLFQCAVVYGQSAHSVNGNVFLKDQHVQVGIAPCGSFGTSDEVPVGQGYYPRSSYHNQLGFVADPAQDGWTTGMPDFIGDYFLPGTPEEGWGLTIGGQNFNNNLICSVNAISGSITNYTSSPTASATWTGTVSQLGNHIITYSPNYLDDNNQSCPLTKSINVFVEVAPAMNLQILCSGNGYNIKALDNSSFAAGVTVSGYDFYVNNGSGEIQLSPVGNVSPNIVSLFQNGSYTFRMVVHYSYNGGATKSCEATKAVELDPIPTVDFTFRDNTCAAASIYFDNLSTNFSKAFWDFSDLSQNTMASVYKVFADQGMYKVQLTVSNNTGCNLSLIKQVTVKKQYAIRRFRISAGWKP